MRPTGGAQVADAHACTRSSMILTSNKRVSESAELFGDEDLAAAILD